MYFTMSSRVSLKEDNTRVVFALRPSSSGASVVDKKVMRWNFSISVHTKSSWTTLKTSALIEKMKRIKVEAGKISFQMILFSF